MLDVVKKEFKDHVGEMENKRNAAAREKQHGGGHGHGRSNSTRWTTFEDDDENCHPNIFDAPQQDVSDSCQMKKKQPKLFVTTTSFKEDYSSYISNIDISGTNNNINSSFLHDYRGGGKPRPELGFYHDHDHNNNPFWRS